MTIVMKYDSRNRANLDKLAPNTRAAAYKWYDYCCQIGADVLIYETIRTVEQQKLNVARGVSQTMKSYHLVGQALDFVPIVNGVDQWSHDAYCKEPYKSAIAYAKSLGFEWGGEWTGFIDTPHLQFNYKGYGTDVKLDAQAATVAAAPQPSQTPGIIGVVRVKATNLNIRSGAGTQYASVGKAVQGHLYNVTANVNDWHQVILDDKGNKGWMKGHDDDGTAFLELVR